MQKQGENAMYKTIIMPVDVFEMELSDKGFATLNSSPRMTELFIYFTYTGVSQPEPAPFCR